MTSGRRARNMIKGLEDGNGNWISGNDGIMEIVVDYFR